MPGNFDGPETGQVRGDELGIQKAVSAISQPGDKIDKCDLAGIADLVKHTLPAKGPTDGHSIESADQSSLLPAFYGMAVPHSEQVFIKTDDMVIDPGVFPFATGYGFGTSPDHLREGGVYAYLKGGFANLFGQFRRTC